MKNFLKITKALSDDNRLRIIMAVKGHPLCLCHFSDILKLAPSTISKHLHMLEEAGLLESRQEGRWRYYRWPEQDAAPGVRNALEWVRNALEKDPRVIEDTARRTVALNSCDAPCPGFHKPRVLFLCTGNSCRSQMAEAFLRKYAGDRFEVFSAGLDTRPIHELTYKVMREAGLDITGQSSKSVIDFLGREHFGYLITVCASAEAKCPIFPGASYRFHWPFDDPEEAGPDGGARIERFREVRDQIEVKILEWLKSMDFMNTEMKNAVHV